MKENKILKYYDDYKNFIMMKLEEINLPCTLDILQKLKDMKSEDVIFISEFVGYLHKYEKIYLMLYDDWYRYVKIFEND